MKAISDVNGGIAGGLGLGSRSTLPLAMARTKSRNPDGKDKVSTVDGASLQPGAKLTCAYRFAGVAIVNTCV